MHSGPKLHKSSSVFRPESLDGADDEAGVMAAEAEAVGDGTAHALLAGPIRHVVEVALRVGLVEVDRRVNHPLPDGQGAGDEFHAAAGAEQMADHALGAADRELLR